MSPTERKQPILPSHFYSLDALRGVAALAIVFWHWQHFFYRGVEKPQFDPIRQPLYSVFKPLYTDGWRAVDLFFCLSGFIFFWLYSEKISTRATSLKTFFVLRFSRLYPLHFLTLLLVAAGQFLMLRIQGEFFVYPCNDLRHFALQTVFASGWGLERGYSFNGPIWSVSVEVLCYAAFFLICLLRCKRWWQLILFMVGGYYLQRTGLSDPGRGLSSFFVGGLAFQVFRYVARFDLPRMALLCLGVFTASLWFIIPYNSGHNIIYGFYRDHIWSQHLSIHGKDYFGAALLIASPYWFELALYPITIMTLALWETHRGTLGKRLAFLGHMSYASYLWHFPLQMVFLGAVQSLSNQREFFYTPLSLLLFYAVLIPVSLCSYRYFELPCQSRIREWVFRNRGLAAEAGDRKDRDVRVKGTGDPA